MTSGCINYSSFEKWKCIVFHIILYLKKNVSIFSLSNWLLEKFSYECSAAFIHYEQKTSIPKKGNTWTPCKIPEIGRKFIELMILIYFHSNIILYNHKILHHIGIIQEYNTVILWHLNMEHWRPWTVFFSENCWENRWSARSPKQVSNDI